MEHITLFFYFLLLSSGFAGLTVTIILWKKTGHSLLGWFVAVIATFTVWLLITLVIYYVESVVRYPVPADQLVGLVTYLLAVAIYSLLFICHRKARPKASLRQVLLFTAPIFIAYLVVAPAVMLIPGLRPTRALSASLLSVSFVFVGTLYLAYLGYSFVEGGKELKQETVAYMVGHLGRLMLLFAPLALTATVVAAVAGNGFDPTVPLDFLLFFGWNVLSIVTFLRYLMRPTALLEEGKVSDGFCKEYGISRREAQVVELISHGMSNKEMASYLNVSFTTARTHVYNIFKKTGARSRVELLRIVSGYRE